MTFAILDWQLNINYKEADVREYLGRIPLILDPYSTDPIWLQIETNYPQGWQPVLGEERKKWTLTADDYLIYSGLPPVAPAALAWHLNERILVYPAGWVVVMNLKGEFTVARVMP